MTTLTEEKLEQKDGQNDYAQALEEGEITRILKTVQAARFQKSETLIATEDKVFKPRSLVEIAFAAEQKQEQKRAEKSETTIESAHNESAAKTEGSGSNLDAEECSSNEIDAQLSDASVSFDDQAQQKAEEAEEQQRREEEEAIRIAAEENGYKRGFEAGLEAAKTADPSPEEIRFLEKKEREREAVIEKFQKAIEAIASPDAVDSSALEAAINKAVLELATERAGLEISENPDGLVARIKKTVEDIKIGAQQAEIRLNPADLAAIEGWLQDRPMPSDWQFVSDENLMNGDMHLKLGGVEISDKVQPDAEKRAGILGTLHKSQGEHLIDDDSGANLEKSMEKAQKVRTDEQNSEGYSGVSADKLYNDIDDGQSVLSTEKIPEENEPIQSEEQNGENSSMSIPDEVDATDSVSALQNATVAQRPAFIPEPSKEVEGEDEIPVLEGFEPVKSEDEIPVLEGFEPVKSEDEIPVLEGFEPVESDEK